MRNSGLKWLLGAVLTVSSALVAFGQSYEAEVPGDNFSLEGALELFRKSSSPEEFERMLNTPDSKVNNLDLNGDGYIDYIRVLSRQDKNVNIFVLQAVISDTEAQDIAVISLEKLANGKAVLQITGDEDIYGVATIIEPTREVRTYAGTYASPVVVNVWSWPIVQYVYGPHYVVWVSNWGWSYRPAWWSPWRPVYYYDYYSYWRPYYRYYSVCPSPRIVYAYNIYHPHRRTSVIVHRRYNTQIVHYRSQYKDGYRNGRTRNDDRYLNSSGGDGTSNGRRRDDTRYSQPREARTSVTPSRQASERTLPDRTRTTRSVTPNDETPATGFQAQPLDRDQAERMRESAAPARTRSTTTREANRTAPARSYSGGSDADNSRPANRSTYTPPTRQQAAPVTIRRENLPATRSSSGGSERQTSPLPTRQSSGSYHQRSAPSSPAPQRSSGSYQQRSAPSSPAPQRSSGTSQRSGGGGDNSGTTPRGRGRN